MSKNTKKLVPKLRFPEFRDAREWNADTLERIAKFRRGSFPQPYGLPKWYDDESGMPFVQVFDVDENLKLKNKTKNKISKLGAEQSVFIAKGTLIVTLQGSIGRVAITQYDAYIDRTLLIFEEFYQPIEKLFFAYVIQSLFEIEKEKAPGGIIKTITKESLSSFVVKLPSFPEQQKIADCLSSIDDLITAQSQKVEALKTHKKGLMQQLFPREGETVPRLRFPEFRDAGEWEKIPVGNIGEVITGNTPSTTMKEYYGGNRLFVSPADMADHRYIHSTKTTLTELGYSKTRQIPADSVLFVCIGSTIGKIAQNKVDCATNQQINAVVPSQDYSSAFIYYSLDLNAQNISELAGRQAVPIINKSIFSTFVLDMPSLNEQQKISECLSSLDELIAFQSERLESLKLHKKGLMQQLFPAANGDVV